MPSDFPPTNSDARSTHGAAPVLDNSGPFGKKRSLRPNDEHAELLTLVEPEQAVPTDYPADWIYIVCGILLVIANLGCWIGTFFLLPGTWVMVAFAALSAFFLPEQPDGLGVSWWCVVILIALAGLGEFLEFVAGAAGAAKEGASRRAMSLALVGAVIGSIVGAVVGIPIPVVGPIVAALGGSAAGAFGGAYLGETWKGRDQEARLAVSKGALIGRLLGTVGKLIVGVVMVAYSSVEAFWF